MHFMSPCESEDESGGGGSSDGDLPKRFVTEMCFRRDEEESVS